jgi:hypothetical protein
MNIVRMKFKDIKTDPIGDALARSEESRPYVNYYDAVLMSGQTARDEALKVIRELPLEKRYIWRVLSALKWGLADFDSENLKLDLPYLSPAERSEMLGELQIRAQQLSILIDKLKG